MLPNLALAPATNTYLALTGCECFPQNDTDSDFICNDDDSCPLDFDSEDDFDSDYVCNDDDSCALDAENDADGDGKCSDNDECPANPSKYIEDDCGCDDWDSDSDNVCNKDEKAKSQVEDNSTIVLAVAPTVSIVVVVIIAAIAVTMVCRAKNRDIQEPPPTASTAPRVGKC